MISFDCLGRPKQKIIINRETPIKTPRISLGEGRKLNKHPSMFHGTYPKNLETDNDKFKWLITRLKYGDINIGVFFELATELEGIRKKHIKEVISNEFNF